VLIENLQRARSTGIGIAKSVIHNFLPVAPVADLATPDLSTGATTVSGIGIEVPFESS
jgi:hypothetical protein